MRLVIRFPAWATVTITGVVLAVTPPRASPAPPWVRHQYVVPGGLNYAVAASLNAVFAAGLASVRLNEATVGAFNPATGAQLWQFRYTAACPDSSKVFVAGNTGLDGSTVAYNS